VHDSSYALTFRLYSVASGGSPLWTEAHSNVPTAKGTFNVILGSVTTLNSVDFNQQLYIGITKGGDPEFSPRSQLTSSPSSLAPWAVNDTNINYRKGNVGIGTATPTSRLHVSNGTYDTRLDGNNLLFSRSDGPAYFDAVNAGGWMDFVTNGRLPSDANSNLVLKPDKNSYFNGALGIGNNNPTYQVHIVDPGNSGIRVQTNSSGGTVASFGANGDFDIDYVNIVGGRFAVRENGNVGIGTGSPGSKLEIDADATTYAAYVTNSSTASYVTGIIGYTPAATGIEHTGTRGTASGASSNYGVYGSAFGGGTNYAGYFSGDLAYTGSLIHASDARLKENIQDINGALPQILRLKPRTFNYRSGRGFNQMNLSPGNHYGLVAQELEEVFPDLVVPAVHPTEHDAQGNPIGETIKYKAIKSLELIPILIEAMQEQQKLIQELQKKVELLEKK
jgi:hypothetical protein